MKRSVQHSFELLYLLVLKELKIRYKNSFLGYLWAIANPIAFALVYYFAFKLIMRVQLQNYSVFLLTGLFPWAWISNSLIRGTTCYKNNAFLIKKVKVNIAILPLSIVFYEMIHFFLALPILMLFLKFTENIFFFEWLWQIPLMILLQLNFIYPIVLISSLVNSYIHDIEYIIGIFLSLLFFLTPIVYPISMIPPKYLVYFKSNPLALLIKNWRSTFFSGYINSNDYFITLFIAFIFSILAFLVYRKSHFKLGELL
ncbi:MAG: ABC transporter permease [Leptospiraceae bacterium]|nr:ABC transporter permease [Leptospiraceae bacterium]MCP5497797.1 ABC transporter permease [Leptospiraceae bacterium]